MVDAIHLTRDLMVDDQQTDATSQNEGQDQPEEKTSEAPPEDRPEAIPEGMMPAAPRRGRGPAAPGSYVRVRLPRKVEGELFAVADQIMGGSRLKLVCEDGEGRMGRIPGKLRRRMWIREGDLLIIKPWEFQPSKADVRFRYTATQSSYLSRQRKIPPAIDIF